MQRGEAAQLVVAPARRIDDLGQQVGAHRVEVRDAYGQHLRHVGGGGARTPLWMRQFGQCEQRARGRLGLQGAAGAVGRQGDAIGGQRGLQAETQRVADERRQHGDRAGRHTLVAHQLANFAGGPAHHLGVEAEGVGGRTKGN